MAIYFDTPQDLGRTLDNGFAIYRASVMPLLPLSFFTALAINLPSIFNYAMVGLEGGAGPFASGILFGMALPIAGIVLYMAGYIGLIFAQDAIARGLAPPTIGQSLGHGFGRLGTTIAMAILLVLVLIVGFVLLVVPGIILSISLGFAMYVVAIEKVGPVEALKRSHALVWGHWWRTMVVVTVAVLLYALPLVLIGGIVAFVMAMGSAATGMESPEEKIAGFTIAMAVVQVVTAGLLMPLMNGFLLAQFNDLKLRKSGADLLARAPA